MHHADRDAHAFLERQAALARRCGCFTWNEDELRASAKRQAGLSGLVVAVGVAAGFLILLLCVLGYAAYRAYAG